MSPSRFPPRSPIDDDNLERRVAALERRVLMLEATIADAMGAGVEVTLTPPVYASPPPPGPVTLPTPLAAARERRRRRDERPDGA